MDAHTASDDLTGPGPPRQLTAWLKSRLREDNVHGVTDSSDYHGVPADYVQTLGQVVIIAGNTERAAHLIWNAWGWTSTVAKSAGRTYGEPRAPG